MGSRIDIEQVPAALPGDRPLRGDGQVPLTPVPPAEQRRALATVLGALTPATLALPETLLAVIPPRPEGFPRHRELFANHTAGTFDALAPAEAAAEITFAVLLEPGRAARLVEQHARNADQPGLDEVIDSVLTATWRNAAGDDYAGEIRRTVDYVALSRLIGLAANPAATPEVRAAVTQRLVGLRDWLAGMSAPTAHSAYGARMITQYLDHPKDFVPLLTPVPPPGGPIGETFGWD